MVKLDWFAPKTRIKDVSEIMEIALIDPAYGRKIMMDQIDISLDNRDAEEFYLLTNILQTMP